MATALCFDVVYGDVLTGRVREGADLAAIGPSNAMFLGTSQLQQRWTVTRVRALETSRSIVVASVNGVSGAIDLDRSILDELPTKDTSSAIVESRCETASPGRCASDPGRSAWRSLPPG